MKLSRKANIISDIKFDAIDDNTIYLCVNYGTSSINSSVVANGVYESDIYNSFGVTSTNNFFKDSDKWIGQSISIEDNGVVNKYTTRIKSVSGNKVDVLDVVWGQAYALEYEQLYR